MKQTTIDSYITAELAQMPHVFANDERATVQVYAGNSTIQLCGDPDTVIEWLNEAAMQVDQRRTRPAVA